MTEIGSRGKWKWVNGEFVEVTDKKKEVNAPFVIPDEIPPTEFMGNANREMYTSKRELERQNKKAADEINKRMGLRPFKPTREELIDDFRKMANAVKYGEVELTEKEKELCRREERQYQMYKKRRQGH